MVLLAAAKCVGDAGTRKVKVSEGSGGGRVVIFLEIVAVK